MVVEFWFRKVVSTPNMVSDAKCGVVVFGLSSRFVAIRFFALKEQQDRMSRIKADVSVAREL